MRRLSLSTKLLAAAIPLVIAIVGLLALTVRSDLEEIDRAENGAELGSVWQPLITALTAVEDEAATMAATTDGSVTEGGSTAAPIADPAVRRATDEAINELRAAIDGLGASEAAAAHVTSSRSALSAARRGVDMAVVAPSMAGDVDPADAYATASRELVAVGQLLPSEAGDEELGRSLLAVVKLAEAKLQANQVIAGTAAWPNDLGNTVPLNQARTGFAELRTTLGEFEAIAPDEWATQFRQSGFVTELGAYGSSLDSVVRAAEAGGVETFDTAGFTELVDRGVEFQQAIADSIVVESNEQADATRTSTMVRIAIILGASLLGLLIAWFITRSITRRVRAVADSANKVADDQLPALVEALRDPRGKAVLPDVEPVDARGADELAALATAFNSMQETLIDVAHEQVEVLRRGVSDIFVTMARRNRSLIDRQLAMLDEFEASVDDPEILSNYYQLDHLATRMRRSSESLLVLANAEPKRRRVKATEIDDVVRASMGEVEDYRRIEIQHLESLQVKGNVVADVSHLLAELLDNATSFSPPGSTVRVGGRKAGNSYMIRIVDDGVGIPPERLGELNELLREPPIVGLSVEATLGMSVVSLLANKHGIDVTLAAGSPGLTVDVVLPSSLFGPMDAPVPTTAPAATATTAAASADVADEQIVAWSDIAADDTPVAAATEPTFVPADEPVHAAAVDPLAMPAVTVDMSAFEASVNEPDPEPVVDEPAAQSAPALTEAGLPARSPAPVADPTDTHDELEHADEVAAETAEESPAAEPALPNLPPPAAARAEFDVPPAPPITAGGLAQRPVSPPTARPAPNPTPANDPGPSLPTRTQRGTGPDGPDRLAVPTPTETPVGTSEPGALQAALAAYDSGRAAVSAQPAGDLPTRDRVGEPAPSFEEAQSVTQSRVDPSALRDRLRAFQSEFSNAHGSDHGPDPHTDLGGDPR